MTDTIAQTYLDEAAQAAEYGEWGDIEDWLNDDDPVLIAIRAHAKTLAEYAAYRESVETMAAKVEEAAVEYGWWLHVKDAVQPFLAPAPVPVDPVKEYFDELAYKPWTPEIAADELRQALAARGWEVRPKEDRG